MTSVVYYTNSCCLDNDKEKPVIGRLLKQHDHIVRTLNLLELQFLELCRGREPDYRIMLSVVAYIQEFPEQVHHPAEDAIFSIFIEQGGDREDIARKLITDHTEIERITRQLRNRIEAMISNETEGRVDLTSELSTFLLRQRRHIYAEERLVFPQLNEILTEQDWDRVTAMVPGLEDPVFGERTQADYERLYRVIESRNQ